MKLSVVVPAYNESASVLEAREAIVSVLQEQLPYMDYEIIFVDDGSSDDTFECISSLCAAYSNVRAIKFVANCGSHMAIRAGLEHATGDIACFIACDLQDPPELIPQMNELLAPPVQIVWAVRSSRKDSMISRLFSRFFYILARMMVSKNIPPSGASMFLLGNAALKAVQYYKERNLTLEGLFATMGFKHGYITYERRARQQGHSKWTLSKRLKLFADFFVGYSYVPIRFMSYLGIIAATLGFIYALLVVGNKIFFYTPIEGYASLMAVVLLIGGIQMVMTGIIGEYIWRTLDEARSRPRYLIDTILEGNQHPESSADREMVSSLTGEASFGE